MKDRVERVLGEVIRPLLEADGGGVELVAVADAVVTLRLTGLCAGCPGAPYTQRRAIEPALRAALGHAVEVRYLW